MVTNAGIRFRNDLAEVRLQLLAVNPDLADIPWRPNGWTRKQIVGHLLDSATNNRQRFVRAAIDGTYRGPGYAQDAWIAVHGYDEQPWEMLLGWWQTEHDILMHVVDHIPAERLEAPCIIADGSPVTLQFVIEDYVRHQWHHLRQMAAAAD